MDNGNNDPVAVTDPAGITTTYTYDPLGNRVDSAGWLGKYGLDQPHLRLGPSGRHSDYSYDPYGNIVGPSGTASTPFLFAGGYFDNESGFYYLINRMYDPSSGQFTSIDPKATQTRTPYTYTANNPVNRTDPTGLDWNLGGAWNAFTGGANDLGHHLEQTFHDNAPMIADVGHAIGMACGTAALISLGVGAAPLAAAAGGCAVVGSLVAMAADADMAAHGDQGHSWGEVGWDALGTIPDAALARTLGRQAYYAARFEKAMICKKAYVGFRNTAEMYENVSWGLAITNEVSVLHDATQFLVPGIK